MFINKLGLIVFLLLSEMIFSQVKVPDTLYVYEKIIIHDTIYLPKVNPLESLIIDKAVLDINSITHECKLLIYSENKIVGIPIKNTIINGEINSKSFFGEVFQSFDKKILNKIEYGISLNALRSINGLFKDITEFTTGGFGFGFFGRKNIVNDKLALGVDVNYSYLVDDGTASGNKSLLGGFYVNGSTVLQFYGQSANHSKFTFPIQLSWNLGKLKPFIGGYYAFNHSTVNFLGSSGTFPLTLDEIVSYKISFSEMGYCAGLRFDLNKRIGFTLNYSKGKAGNLKFKKTRGDRSEFYDSDTDFKNTQVSFSVQYKLGIKAKI